MSGHVVDVQIDGSYRASVEPTALRRAAEATLEREDVEEQCELVVVVTGDETLRELNWRHRGVDAPTDVLAFPHQKEGPPPFVSLGDPEFPRYLGDVIISFQRAEEQAAEAPNDRSAELQLLVVHGVLHLLGYEDETEEARADMWRAQQAVLDELGIEIQFPG